MSTSRFNDHSRERAISSEIRNYLHKIQIPELGRLRTWKSSGEKRIFAIVARPTRSQMEGKTIRRILIFDNHPDTLALIFETGIDPDKEDAAGRRTSIICGSILIVMVLAAMLWPLFW